MKHTYFWRAIYFTNLLNSHSDDIFNEQLVWLKSYRMYLSNHEGKRIEASKEANSNTDEEHEAWKHQNAGQETQQSNMAPSRGGGWERQLGTHMKISLILENYM